MCASVANDKPFVLPAASSGEIFSEEFLRILQCCLRYFQAQSESRPPVPLKKETFSHSSAGTSEIGSIPAVATLQDAPNEETILGLSRPQKGCRLSLESPELTEDEKLKQIDLVLSSTSSKPSKEELTLIYSFFNEAPYRFLNFLEIGDSNIQFDHFVSSLDDELYSKEENVTLRAAVTQFAFRKKRFESIQIKDEMIDPNLVKKMIEFERNMKSPAWSENIRRL